MVNMGEKLKNLRKARNLSQSALAEALLVTKSMISAYETSVRMPSYDVLLKISHFFNVSTDYLLGCSREDVLDVSKLTEEQKQILRSLVREFQGE
ncbi:MAG: helix-turn-helix transcriptional regulator [Eubacteriales bacterium]